MVSSYAFVLSAMIGAGTVSAGSITFVVPPVSLTILGLIFTLVKASTLQCSKQLCLYQ
jgi:hypothetical protein